MKSSAEQLARRGYLTEDSYRERFDRAGFEIDAALRSDEALVRTAAVRKIRRSKRHELIPQLCNLLKSEERLYTRLEACDCLAEFGPLAVPHLLPLLGAIGSNQHEEPGSYDLAKKSFPLPRDLAARILVRIGPPALLPLRAFLSEGRSERVRSEAFDLIGHVALSSGDQSFEGFLIDEYEGASSPLLKWKIVRALQSFDSARIQALLRGVRDDARAGDVLRREAQRSLDRIGTRLLRRNPRR